MIISLYAHTGIYVKTWVFPCQHRLDGVQVKQALVKEKIEYFSPPDFLSQLKLQTEKGYGNKMSVRGEHPLGDYCMDVRVPVDKIAERLHSPDHSVQASFIVYLTLHDFAYSFVSQSTEIAEKASGEPKINSQPFGNGKYPLPVWDFGHNFVKQPVSENQSPLLVAWGAASALLAGERYKKLLSAFGTAHSCEAML
jgi:hypothetical protein